MEPQFFGSLIKKGVGFLFIILILFKLTISCFDHTKQEKQNDICIHLVNDWMIYEIFVYISQNMGSRNISKTHLKERVVGDTIYWSYNNRANVKFWSINKIGYFSINDQTFSLKDIDDQVDSFHIATDVLTPIDVHLLEYLKRDYLLIITGASISVGLAVNYLDMHLFELGNNNVSHIISIKSLYGNVNLVDDYDNNSILDILVLKPDSIASAYVRGFYKFEGISIDSDVPFNYDSFECKDCIIEISDSVFFYCSYYDLAKYWKRKHGGLPRETIPVYIDSK